MPRRGQDGFALPLTIFLIALVTLMLTAAFTKVQADRRLADSSGAAITALSIARSAVQKYMGTRVVRPVDGDSVRINVSGGYGDVIARVIRRPADTLANWLYIIRGTGHAIEPTQGADPLAARTIAQFAQWQTGRMDVPAALVAANNVSISTATGADVYINGYDYCGLAPPVASARLPSSGGGNDIPGGSPTYWSVSPPRVESGNGASTAQSLNIDFTAITGGGFTPDFTSIQLGSGAYASQYIDGSATLSTNFGTGLLMVTGDLTFSGVWAQWYGIILVGGRVYFNTSDYTYIQGTLMSGLAEAQGYSISSSTVGNKDIFIYYDSCAINTTLQKLTGFAPITNGWVDNWAQY